MAFDRNELALQAQVKIRLENVVTEIGGESSSKTIETTLGRALFNETLPENYPFVNEEVKKSKLGEVINDLAERYSKVQVAATLDALKEAGFRWATRSGVTISFADVVAPSAKAGLLAEAEEKADKIQKQYDRGLIADSERRQELIEVWTDTTNKVAEAMQENFPTTNPVWMMVNSGARGNMLQIRQIAGMRGLVANPKGEIIPRPIKSNFREGLSVLEYFISTHGARKGLADTALRTADSGYLTRRLVDVSQDVIIREEDCGTDRGLAKAIRKADGSAEDFLDTTIASRCLAEDVVVDGKTLFAAGQDIGILDIDAMVAAGVDEIKVRSVLTCDSRFGTCARCYGRSLATSKLVDIGEAVGIIAAQSIGEPGTQLTMRTFHTGGAASDGGDITHGLPRVVELFEARTPKGVSPISAATGRVRIDESDKAKKVIVIPDDGSEELEYPVSKRAKLVVEDGQTVTAGDLILVGKPDPKEVLRIRGPRQVQIHLTDEVQEVYRSQGVSIHDKHIEVIVRQMLKRVVIVEQAESTFLTGELVERSAYENDNRRIVAENGKPASARPELMGITKASLATESWLSAASFQETTRVLTDAAINGKRDPLLGLKENVIIGKLIPAGTGLPRYRNVKVEPTEEAKAAVYAAMSVYDDYDYGDFGQASGEAVRLEDYDMGQYRS
jgi:DNA-directed RNA polymerase subunit beta'